MIHTMEHLSLPSTLLALALLGFTVNIVGRLVQRAVSSYKPKGIGTPSDETRSRYITDSILSTSVKTQHPSARALATLIQEDGGGSWPPKTNHVVSTWPLALRPYRQIWDDLAPLIPSPNDSRLLDDDANRKRIYYFRCRMREHLALRINVEQVKEALTDGFPGQDTINAFYCCIAMLRHGYRWAIIPVVKVAQRETVLTLPPELDVPWKLLQSRYGLTSESSNLTANFIHNFTDSGEYALKINVGMPDHIQQCEELFARIPYDMERLALPIYNEVIEAIIAYENSDKAAVVGHLENISLQLKDALSVFYENMHNGRIPRSVWMSHVQGFQAWGLEKIDRETNTGEKIHVRDDGLSGSHILLFQVLDAFLGIERYLSPADFLKFVPARQREFCDIVRKYSPRGRLSLGPEVASDDGHARLDSMIDSGFKRIAERLRVFRAAHRSRVMPYLSVPAPERHPMTAGKSVFKDGSLESSLEFLNGLLVTRYNQTA